MTTLRMFVLAAIIVYAAFAAFAWFLGDGMMFQPPAPSYREGRMPIVHVRTVDGASIAMMHLPNPNASLTLLYSHGNAEDIGQLAPVLAELRDAGYAVLAYDYRGYGLSTGGPPSTRGAVRDAEAVYRHAIDSLKIPSNRLVLYGRSVGSGPATDVAARFPVGGLVIESGFVSAFRVLTRATLLPFDRFPNERSIARVRAPVLVMHGTDDEVIGFWHGPRLFAAARGPRLALWVEGAHHNDVGETAGDKYFAALKAFSELVITAGHRLD